jgi:2-polyprenyl-6-hydroxyphenyl methylase/3-demethylubiquinone-9 3-methyltransferase
MTAIPTEIERFNRLSVTWWDSHGPMRPLHVVNALRLNYVIAQIALHRGVRATDALAGLRILDVGCGGGLLSEALARLGATVVGVDASPGNVAAARLHAESHGVTVDYRMGEVADVLSPQEDFDVVLALEVVEHVSDISAFLEDCAGHLTKNGIFFASTINRTFKSLLFAIIGAEYLLRVLPRGTHQWSMFVSPDELSKALARCGLQRKDLRGMRYLPVLHRASWTSDIKVNYIATYTQSAARF